MREVGDELKRVDRVTVHARRASSRESALTSTGAQSERRSAAREVPGRRRDALRIADREGSIVADPQLPRRRRCSPPTPRRRPPPRQPRQRALLRTSRGQRRSRDEALGEGVLRASRASSAGGQFSPRAIVLTDERSVSSTEAAIAAVHSSTAATKRLALAHRREPTGNTVGADRTRGLG